MSIPLVFAHGTELLVIAIGMLVACLAGGFCLLLHGMRQARTTWKDGKSARLKSGGFLFAALAFLLPFGIIGRGTLAVLAVAAFVLAIVLRHRKTEHI